MHLMFLRQVACYFEQEKWKERYLFCEVNANRYASTGGTIPMFPLPLYYIRRGAPPPPTAPQQVKFILFIYFFSL